MPTAVAFAASDVLQARVVVASVLLGQLLLAGMVAGVRSDLRRRAVQQVLHEREAHLSSVLEAAGDAFVSADASGRITDWNAQAERLFGRDRDTALGAPVHAVLVPASGSSALEEQVARLVEPQTAATSTVRLELTVVDATVGPSRPS